MRIRSGYSFRTAVGMLPDVMSRIKEIGWNFAPISDRMSTFGYTRWTKLAKKEGLRPIYGVEIGVAERIGDKRPIMDYWTFFAKDRLRDVHDLLYAATQSTDREPHLLYSQVAREARGVVAIAGPNARLDLMEPRDDLFVGLDPSLPLGQYRKAKERGFRFMATSQNYYARPTDEDLYLITIKFASTQTYPTYILGDVQWRHSVDLMASRADMDEALSNRDAVADRCRAEQKAATLLVPPKEKTLRALCIEGAARKKVDLTSEVYGERLERELRLIEEKNFEDYFYIVSDLIRWAKQHMIVGPARGSSCGSLVCYLLDITAIDPIPYDLVFERFIDSTRSDLPDIDVDFSDARRHMIFKYMEERYGKERVARLGTVMMFQAKSALAQVGMALKIPTWMTDKVATSVIKRSKGDSRADLKIADTLRETDAGREMLNDYPEAEIIARMEGHPATSSQHAAGVLLTNEPIRDVVAVDSRTNAAMCDLEDAKDLNLLKLDALGLTQLSTFERVLEQIGKPQSSEWLETIPLEDQSAFKVINDRHYSGVFQFEGLSLQHIAHEIKVDSVEDLIAMTALCRPGPLGSGGTESWIRRKNGVEPVSIPHPVFEPYVKDSLGIMVYQEQIMRIGREVGGLSWEDVNALRRAMSKSLGKEFFDKYGDPWKRGAMARGVTKEVAEHFWDMMCSYGMMGFNRAHAVAYGMVSYWSAYLKAHHPLEFAAATLDAEVDPARQIAILRELKEEGTDYVPVDVDHSTDRWMVVEKEGRRMLVGPLHTIRQIGPAAVREILDARAPGGKPLKMAVKKRLMAARTDLDSLYPVRDAVARLHPDLTEMNIRSTPTPVIKVEPQGGPNYWRDILIIAMLVKSQPLNENEPSRVAKRKGKVLTGKLNAVNFFVRDDSAEIFCKISRYKYDELAKNLLNFGKGGSSLFAIKGDCPPDFRMIWVNQIKYLGEVSWDRSDWLDFLERDFIYPGGDAVKKPDADHEPNRKRQGAFDADPEEAPKKKKKKKDDEEEEDEQAALT